MIGKEQQVFFLKVGVFDRTKIINKFLAKINEDGWEAKSLTYQDEQHMMILADKVLPPPMIISMPDMSYEETEEVMKNLEKALSENKPIFLHKDVTVHRLDEPELRQRTVHVTREMLKRWREEDDLDSDE